jgi:hypothetical protein
MTEQSDDCPGFGESHTDLDLPYLLVEIRGVYDGALYFVCSNCGYAWPRFTDVGRRADQSRRYADQHNRRKGTP